MSKFINKYVIISDKPYKVYKDKNGMTYFIYNNKKYKFDRIRDGLTVSAEEAAKLCPEYFI